MKLGCYAMHDARYAFAVEFTPCTMHLIHLRCKGAKVHEYKKRCIRYWRSTQTSGDTWCNNLVSDGMYQRLLPSLLCISRASKNWRMCTAGATQMVWSPSCIVVTTSLHRRPASLQYVHLLHMQLFSNPLLAHWMRSTAGYWGARMQLHNFFFTSLMSETVWPPHHLGASPVLHTFHYLYTVGDWRSFHMHLMHLRCKGAKVWGVSGARITKKV